MPHFHDQPGQHDLVVSFYIYRTDFNEPKIMLHMHKKLKKWMQFGGHVELNENPWQTFLHELVEETGYQASQLTLLQPHERMQVHHGAELHPQPVCINTHEVIPGHNHIDICYAFIANQAPAGLPGEGEATEFKLFSKPELEALTDVDASNVTKPIALYIFDNAIDKWDQVKL